MFNVVNDPSPGIAANLYSRSLRSIASLEFRLFTLKNPSEIFFLVSLVVL